MHEHGWTLRYLLKGLTLRQWSLFAETADRRLRREKVEFLNLTAAAFGADSDGLDALRRDILGDDYADAVEDGGHIATPMELERVGIKVKTTPG